jgi:hypothetical protein
MSFDTLTHHLGDTLARQVRTWLLYRPTLYDICHPDTGERFDVARVGCSYSLTRS